MGMLFKALLLLLSFSLVAGCAYEGHIPSEVKGYPLLGGTFDGLWFTSTGYPHSGILRFSDGRVYEGNFYNGNDMYQGRMVYPDGREIVGYFGDDSDGNKANGTLTYRDARVFKGLLVAGLPQGQGTMEYPNGDAITGMFKAGRPNGVALEMKANGSRYYGPFKNGAKAGVGYCLTDGQASICSRNGEDDNTQQALNDRGAARASQKMKDDAKTAQDQLAKEFKSRIATKQSEFNQLRSRRSRQEGPTREGDFNCFCTIVELCLTVRGANEKVEKEKERLQDERRMLQCREKYSEWLQIGKSPDFAARLAALGKKIEAAQQDIDAENAEMERRKKSLAAEWANRAADKAAMERLHKAEAAKEESLWKKKAQDEVERCTKAPLRPADCRCRAVLKIVEKPVRGSVCEA